MKTKAASHVLVLRPRTLLLAVLAVIILFGTFPVRHAHAWGYGGSSGKPGAAVAPQIYVADLYQGNVSRFTLMSDAGPIAYRSPASTGAQDVLAMYTVEWWNGSSWVILTQSGPHLQRIGATEKYTIFPSVYFQPNFNQGSFRVTWVFAWSTSTGTQLGATMLVPNAKEDHVCLTKRCISVPGYFWVQ
jgi:hypothetical protein